MTARKQAAEVFSPAEYVRDEMKARRWSKAKLAMEMGGDLTHNLCVLDFLFTGDKRLILDGQTAAKLAKAFGTSAKLWIKIGRAWQKGGAAS